MMSKKKEYYSNPLGEFAEEDFAKIKQEGNVDEFLSGFRITEQKCPPKKFRPVNIV